MTLRTNVDCGFFESEGFAIRNKIKRKGWDFLNSFDELIYPSLVCEFFKNAIFDLGRVVSTIKGVHILIYIDLLAQTLRMHTNGSSSD